MSRDTGTIGNDCTSQNPSFPCNLKKRIKLIVESYLWYFNKGFFISKIVFQTSSNSTLIFQTICRKIPNCCLCEKLMRFDEKEKAAKLNTTAKNSL